MTMEDHEVSPSTIQTGSLGDLQRLSSQAKTNARLRCMGTSSSCAPSDPVQVMFNAILPNAYIRPHRHRSENRVRYIVLTGAIVVVMFDSDGNITWAEKASALDSAASSDAPFMADIPGQVYHTVLSVDDRTVIYMVKPGPYTDDDKLWPQWAPEVPDYDHIDHYMKELRDRLKIVIDLGRPFRTGSQSTSLIDTSIVTNI